MSDNQLIRWIRQTPELERIWDTLTADQKRVALRDADGDTWHLDEVLEGVRDEN